MDEDYQDSPPRARLRNKLLLAAGFAGVLLIALFFIPGGEVAADIDLQGMFSGYTIRDAKTDFDEVPLKKITLDIGGTNYQLMCGHMPTAACARYFFGQLRKETTTKRPEPGPGEEGLEIENSFFTLQAFRRSNIIACVNKSSDPDPQTSESWETGRAILRTLDAAVASHSPHVTYRRLSLGEQIFRNLRFRAILAWEDAQRQWNQLGWRLGRP